MSWRETLSYDTKIAPWDRTTAEWKETGGTVHGTGEFTESSAMIGFGYVDRLQRLL